MRERPTTPLWRWRLAALLVAVPFVVATSGTAATPGAPAARAVTLKGTTRITWTGARGIRIHVPKRTQLPVDGGTRIFVKGGSYAFVRFIRYRECEPPWDFCVVQKLSYVRENAIYLPQYAPGLDHERELTTPPVIEKDTYDFFLFTDGEATLELAPSGYSGRVERVAAGRVAGGVTLVPSACPTAGCTPTTGYGNRLRFGGLVRDVGMFGFAEMRTYNFDVADYPVTGVGVPYAQPHPVRSCIYPGFSAPNSSPDPADHPTGCDVVSTDDTLNGMSGTVTFASGAVAYGGAVVVHWDPNARGRVYLGFQAANAYDLSKPRVLPYAISFRYGIS